MSVVCNLFDAVQVILKVPYCPAIVICQIFKLKPLTFALYCPFGSRTLDLLHTDKLQKRKNDKIKAFLLVSCDQCQMKISTK